MNSALAIAAHGFTAERIWLMRLRDETTDGDSIWPELSARACESLAARNASALATYLDGLDAPDLTRNVRYRNSKGVVYATPAGDVLRHLLLHSAYHRGQAAAALREAGAEPPVTDFIAFTRDGQRSGVHTRRAPWLRRPIKTHLSLRATKERSHLPILAGQKRWASPSPAGLPRRYGTGPCGPRNDKQQGL